MSAGEVVVTVGDLVLDVAVRVETAAIPRADTTSTVAVRQGGSAANVAVAVSAAGGRARFVGAVGDDLAGRLLVEELANAGVDVRAVHRGHTGAVVALVDADGERSMLTDRGAAPSLEAVPAGSLDDAAAVHVPAYGLLGGGPVAEVAASLLERTAPGVVISIDASSVSLLDRDGVARLEQLCDRGGIDLVAANVDEATALGWPGPWLEGVPVRIVKLGGDGAELDVGGDRVSVPTDPIVGVDSTGAGDAFAGGVLAALVQGAGIDDAVRYGHAAASRLLRARRNDQEQPRAAHPPAPRDR